MTMGAFIPVIVWLVSALICHAIAKRRNVRVTPGRILAVVILGPLAIPIFFLFRPGS